MEIQFLQPSPLLQQVICRNKDEQMLQIPTATPLLNMTQVLQKKEHIYCQC